MSYNSSRLFVDVGEVDTKRHHPVCTKVSHYICGIHTQTHTHKYTTTVTTTTTTSEEESGFERKKKVFDRMSVELEGKKDEGK